GHVVEGEPHDVDERHRGDDRGGDGDRADQGVAQVVEEEQDDQHGQDGAEDQVELDVGDRVLDVRRVVDRDGDPHVAGVELSGYRAAQLGLDGGQLGVHPL